MSIGCGVDAVSRVGVVGLPGYHLRLFCISLGLGRCLSITNRVLNSSFSHSKDLSSMVRGVPCRMRDFSMYPAEFASRTIGRWLRSPEARTTSSPRPMQNRFVDSALNFGPFGIFPSCVVHRKSSRNNAQLPSKFCVALQSAALALSISWSVSTCNSGGVCVIRKCCSLPRIHTLNRADRIPLNSGTAMDGGGIRDDKGLL